MNWSSHVVPADSVVPKDYYDLVVVDEDIRDVEGRRQLVLTFEIETGQFKGLIATSIMNVKTVLTPNSRMAQWGSVLCGRREAYRSGDFKGKRCQGLVEINVRDGNTKLLRVTEIRPATS